MTERVQYLLMFTTIATVAFFCGSLLSTAPLQANTAPNYGIMPFTVANVSSTADQDILAAPGAGKRWVISSIAWNILVEEADKLVIVEDKATAAVNITEFAPEIQGSMGYIDFEQGIPCSINSGVQVDLTSTTADVWVGVTAYIQRTE